MISAMNYQDRIVRDPQIVGGEPVLKGTRVTLKTVLASLAEGATTAEILADFPTLSEGGRESGHRLCCCVRPGGSAVGRNAGQTVRIKLDENLPDRLVTVLTTLGHDVDTVHGEQLTGRADPEVWSAAQSARRFLITQDLDFSDIRRYRPGTHAGLLLVRLPRPGRNALLDRVTALFRTEQIENWAGCLVVATDQKVRIRRPERPNEC